MVAVSFLSLIAAAVFGRELQDWAGQDLQPVRDFHAALGLDKSPSLCRLELVTCSETAETGYTLTVPNGAAAGVRLDAALTSSFPNLQELHASGAGFEGPLPADLGGYRSLTVLDLSSNSLTGTLPAAWASLTELRAVSVQRNKLSGTLPPEYGEWTGIEQFFAAENALTGLLPASYANWTVIQGFLVSANRLTGSLPAEYRRWEQLEQMHVAGNALTGSLPDEFAALTNLRYVDLSRNRFAGSFPASYAAWTQLEKLHAQNNFLTGSLPPEFGAWGALEDFLVSFNQLSGKLPDAFALWAAVKRFDVAQNKLSSGAHSPRRTQLGRMSSKSTLTGTVRKRSRERESAAFCRLNFALGPRSKLFSSMRTSWQDPYLLIIVRGQRRSISTLGTTASLARCHSSTSTSRSRISTCPEMNLTARFLRSGPRRSWQTTISSRMRPSQAALP
jgi:hypothetical protein